MIINHQEALALLTHPIPSLHLDLLVFGLGLDQVFAEEDGLLNEGDLLSDLENQAQALLLLSLFGTSIQIHPNTSKSGRMST